MILAHAAEVGQSSRLLGNKIYNFHCMTLVELNKLQLLPRGESNIISFLKVLKSGTDL